MKKYIISALCLALFSNITFPLLAQKADTDLAIDESVRREALRRELANKLEQALLAQKRGALNESAKLYTDCLELVKRIGSGVEGQYIQSLDGFTITRLQVAEQAQRAGDYAAADDQFARILREDPRNQRVVQLRKENETVRVAEAGRRPSDAAIARLPDFYTNRVEAATLVQNGRLFLEAGKMDEAEASLKQAIKMDPHNRAADYYLQLIADQRYRNASMGSEQIRRDRMVEIERAWTPPLHRDLPGVSMFAKTNMIYTGRGRQKIYNKLETIRLNELSYDSIPLGQVIEQLSKDAKNRDPEKKGLNFIINSTVLICA